MHILKKYDFERLGFHFNPNRRIHIFVDTTGERIYEIAVKKLDTKKILERKHFLHEYDRDGELDSIRGIWIDASGNFTYLFTHKFEYFS